MSITRQFLLTSLLVIIPMTFLFGGKNSSNKPCTERSSILKSSTSPKKSTLHVHFDKNIKHRKQTSTSLYQKEFLKYLNSILNSIYLDPMKLSQLNNFLSHTRNSKNIRLIKQEQSLFTVLNITTEFITRLTTDSTFKNRYTNTELYTLSQEVELFITLLSPLILDATVYTPLQEAITQLKES